MPETREKQKESLGEEKEPNAQCIICGKRYHICNDCKNIKSAFPWRTVADTVTCYKIFMALKQYLDGDISKEEAKDILSNINIGSLDSYTDWVQFQLKRIMG